MTIRHLRVVPQHIGSPRGDGAAGPRWAGGSLVHRYLSELAVAQRSPETVRIRRYQVTAWFGWLADRGTDVTEAGRADCIEFLTGFDAAETRASYRAALRGFHQWMVTAGLRTDDPTANLPAVHRDPGMPHPIPDAILVDVLDRATPRQRDMLILGRFAGLRVAEIARAHPDYLGGTPGREVVRLRGKGGRVRELPAHPDVIDVLRSADGWLFPSPSLAGGPIKANTVSVTLGKLLPDGWTAHSLRHAFATEAYRRTHDLRLVQSWLGHANPTTTIIYVGVEHDFDAIRALRLSA